MAHIESITIFTGNLWPKGTISVRMNFNPVGTHSADVPIPDNFYDSLMKMAQLYADLEEQKMRAQILADHDITPKENAGHE